MLPAAIEIVNIAAGQRQHGCQYGRNKQKTHENPRFWLTQVRAGMFHGTNRLEWRTITKDMTPENSPAVAPAPAGMGDLKSTRLNSSHLGISYAVFCLKKKK